MDDQDGDTDYLLAVYIRKDMAYEFYKRKIVDLLLVLADVGGLKEFAKLCGSILVNYIAGRMFMGRIVKKVYQIRNYQNIEAEARNKEASQTLYHNDAEIHYGKT